MPFSLQRLFFSFFLISPISVLAAPQISAELLVDADSANNSPLIRNLSRIQIDDETAASPNESAQIAAEENGDVIGFRWHHVRTPFMVSAWLVVACVAKILFHVNKKFGEAIPDSALLIVVGLIVGWALKNLGVDPGFYHLPSDVFFLYLLPPIIFDAGYFMPNRQLFDNFGSVMMFAVVGTIWNTVAIGATLALFGHWDWYQVKVSTEDSLLFASLISAVDPVAVITVFEEIHVNEFLFINVFGEALFNDGIAAVLFQIFKRVSLIQIPNLHVGDYFNFTGNFFAVALGGVFIGLVFAAICAIATKHTERVRIVGPAFIFVLPYMAYLTAEMFGLSAILAVCCCGIAMKQYVKGNISHEAASSVKYFVKMLAQSSETCVFMFLGLSAMSSKLVWDWWFIGITLIACLAYRTIGVVVQCWILNFFRAKKFELEDQFVMSYGGLRGAIAFGLLSSVPLSSPARDIFSTTTLVVICFTVFIQGTTIRPLLHLLNVERKEEKEESMAENVFNKVSGLFEFPILQYFDYTMAGIEDIIAQRGQHFVRDWFERVNAKILKPILMRDTVKCDFDASKIVRAYHKIAMQDALNYVKGDPNTQWTVRSMSSVSQPKIVESIESPVVSEAVYKMFNDLLDQKLSDLRRAIPRIETDDDIKDDYLPDSARREMHRSRSSVNLENVRSRSNSIACIGLNLNPQRLMPTIFQHREEPQVGHRIRPVQSHDHLRNESKF